MDISECERKFVMVKNHNTSVCLELRTSILINHIVLAFLETKVTTKIKQDKKTEKTNTNSNNEMLRKITKVTKF